MTPSARAINLPTELGSMRFQPDYRMCVVLEPSGVIRSVTDVHGVDGWHPEAAIGRHIGSVAAGGVRGAERYDEWVRRVAAAAAAEGPAHYADLRPDQPCHERPLVDTMVTPVRGPGGALETIVVHIQDGTSLRTQDALVREQHGQLATALELSGLASYTFYLREPRMDTDDRFKALYGLDPQRLVEDEGIEGFFRVIHDEDSPRVRAALEAAMDGTVAYVANYRLWARRPGGPELRYIEALGRVESDDIGPLRVVGVIEDVTERRAEEAARQRLEKREAIGTLAGGIAHDFNNVISAILSNASVAEAELMAGQSPATSLREITRGARRAGDVVGRLLTFSREEVPRQEPFSLALVVEEACALLRPALPGRIELRASIAGSLPSAIGDAGQLHQVVVNLVTNAGHAIAEALPATGAIEVLVDAIGLEHGDADLTGGLSPGSHLRLRVRDDGPGIPDAIAPQVFEPFFTTKPVGKGTGLGLSATQGIVRSHGGTIAVETQVGAGTLFTVLLPAAPERRAPAANAALGARPRRPADTLPRVLFIDDERALTRLAERAMPASSCAAVVFNDASAALAALQADPHAFAAIVTDLSMPGMTGLEVADRAQRIRPGIPIVLSSGFVSAEVAEQARARGVGRIVPKPCAIEDLARAVLELLDEAPR